MKAKLDKEDQAGRTDLLKKLSEATEYKAPPSTFSADQPAQINPEPQIKEEDFAPPPPPPDQPEPPSAETPTEEEPKVKRPFSYYLAMAESNARMIDGLTVAYLPTIIRKKDFTPDQYERGLQLIDKVLTRNITEDQFNEEELYIYRKMKQYDEKVKNIAFSESEIELIKQPLAEVIEKYGANTGPETQLILALGTVLGVRLLPVIF